jgi:hypothetical protein
MRYGAMVSFSLIAMNRFWGLWVGFGRLFHGWDPGFIWTVESLVS